MGGVSQHDAPSWLSWVVLEAILGYLGLSGGAPEGRAKKGRRQIWAHGSFFCPKLTKLTYEFQHGATPQAGAAGSEGNASAASPCCKALVESQFAFMVYTAWLVD